MTSRAVPVAGLLDATRVPLNQSLGRRLPARSSLLRRLEGRPVCMRRRAAICTQAGVVTVVPLVQSLPRFCRSARGFESSNTSKPFQDSDSPSAPGRSCPHGGGNHLSHQQDIDNSWGGKSSGCWMSVSRDPGCRGLPLWPVQLRQCVAAGGESCFMGFSTHLWNLPC